MTPDFLQPACRSEDVVLSVLIAVFTSYVALDLAARVRGKDALSAGVWTAGGALVLGSGIWSSMHFVGMQALLLPFAVGCEPFAAGLSWVAAVAVSWLALRIASGERLTPRALLAAAGVMGGGICTMHSLGMAAQHMAPGIVCNAWLVAASAAVACTASAVALAIVFGMRRLGGMQARAAQAGAALVMGAAIAAMHGTGMAAAGFAPGSVCLSSGGLGGQGVGLVVALAIALLLSLTLFVSVLDARMEGKACLLAASLKDANARIDRMALLDPLTGIPNRALFEDRLGHAAARVDRALRQPGCAGMPGLGLLFIDLDDFQPINDSYGHAAGDAVLRLVADRLAATARGSDTLARIGGDEFVLLVEEITGAPHAIALAERVLAALAEPFDLAGRRLTLSCSIGVALYPQHGTCGALLTNADAAMHAAKRAGGNTVAVFEAPMRDDISHHLELQQTLREAIERGQLQLHYQSKIDAASGDVCGAEALLRWTHPTQGPISPAVFIPIAERSGLIMPIGNWVIDEACRQLAAWQRQGRRMRVSINLSAHQLRRMDVVDRLRQAMACHGVGADQIVCEITESVAMQDTRATQNVIEELNALGVKLSIDDFGTGYSSLGSLRQLHAHELKIDRSFVRDVATDVDALAVVDAVVRLAQALGMRVVAEGVETLAQRDVLVGLGCDELQGFYFARPVSAETFVGASGEPPRAPALRLPAVPAS